MEAGEGDLFVPAAPAIMSLGIREATLEKGKRHLVYTSEIRQF